MTDLKNNQMVKRGLHVVIFSDPLTCTSKLCDGTIAKVIQESGVYEGHIVYNIMLKGGKLEALQYNVLSTVRYTV